MKNKLIDLNDHLFAQIERLGDENLKGDALSTEINRSKAMAAVAKEVVNNASLALNAHKAMREGTIRTAPEMIGADPQ